MNMRKLIKQEYEYFGYPKAGSGGSACSTSSNVSSLSGSTVTDKLNNIKHLNIKPIQEDYLGFTVYEALRKVGVCVIDNFIKESSAKKLHEMVESMSSFQGLLHDPLMNVSMTSENFTRYRDDYITWLSGTENGYEVVEVLNDCIYKVVKLFYRYSLTQNKRFKLGHRSMVQASCFPPQSMGYRLHSDNPNNNGRLLTFVYHCNKGYTTQSHGGHYRFFVNDKFADVEPKYNRLVIYWSSTMLEILPCKSSMYSLTSWYFGNIDQQVTENNETNTNIEQYQNL